MKTRLLHIIFPAALAIILPVTAGAKSVARTTSTSSKSSASISESSKTKQRIRRTQHSRPVAHRRHRRVYERFYTSSFDDNTTQGDITAGEDPIVRQAAIEALGNMNGTVVALDPNSGRILAMVNQKLALSEGAQPCSTIKLSVALAALSENVVTKDTEFKLSRYRSINLTEALAISNNAYFEALGRKLGFEKVAYYAHQFGLGELAGWNIQGEHLGEYPTEVLDSKLGGVGKMCSFGESISMTPLQLGAMVGAIANGGTLYYLQHPTSPEDVVNFKPVVKRQLQIAPLIPEMTDGMAGAVDYGTARTVHYNFSEEQIMGKTGTCSKDGTRFGWFASFANTQYGRIVVVVFLRGGRPTYGPKAAEIAGHMYRGLYDKSFFAASPVTPARSAAAAVGVSQ
jgi:penicillin-binding protein 2